MLCYAWKPYHEGIYSSLGPPPVFRRLKSQSVAEMPIGVSKMRTVRQADLAQNMDLMYLKDTVERVGG